MNSSVQASPEEIKSAVVRAARDLGFDDCRIASIHRATHADEFEAWIADGKHGDMAWLARAPDRRTRPDLVLPGAQAMVIVAMNYFVGEPAPQGVEASAAGGSAATTEAPATQAPATGVFARYAWGDDYHDLMHDRLRALADVLASHGGIQKLYVDTGPVLERDFATDAGLGWNGKSTVQIHRHLGTWFFLGELITTLPLPPDRPFGDHCGKCTRCLDACPTRALTSPHHLDARRCLSYLTIEHKGPIPLEFREALGRRIYGCDDCLAVCPWNRFAQMSREAAFSARSHVADWSLRDFLGLDDDGFRTLFKGSPIKRLKRPGFLRNVCVALGNSGTRDDLPALRAAAADPHPLIAEHACWAVQRILEKCPPTGTAAT
ncbi:MAG: tRNA epoxyqueuosine(34) reductase QueG [Verrucomicrobiales bacterium]